MLIKSRPHFAKFSHKLRPPLPTVRYLPSLCLWRYDGVLSFKLSENPFGVVWCEWWMPSEGDSCAEYGPRKRGV